MRRKEGALVPLELDILGAALELAMGGPGEFHGFEMAKMLQTQHGGGRLAAHGTLYKALGRLLEMGMLTSRWEDPAAALEERRPPRRYYRVTAMGERAYSDGIRALQSSRQLVPSGSAAQ